MALTYTRVKAEAESIQASAELVRTALLRAEDVLSRTSEQSIDWAAGSKPAYIDEDASGNLDGLAFSRQQIANVIGSLSAFRNLMTNQSVAGLQGDHLGNLNQVTRPLG